MPRYIDADALPQKRYIDSKQLASSIADYMIAFDNGWNACIDEIGKQPTVSHDEARGVGKWIKCGPCRMVKCSVCSGREYEDEATPYCPQCGAKMEVSEDA